MLYPIRVSGFFLLVLLHLPCGSRTGLTVPPGPPSPDIECGQQANIPVMTFSVGFDSTFSADPGVRIVTWHLRYRCLNRTERAGPDSTPGNCPSCFYATSEEMHVTQDFAHPLAFSPADFSSFRVDNPVLSSRSLSFQVLNAPSARWCVVGWVEFRNGGTPPRQFGPVTRLLTAGSHTDTGFMFTGGPRAPTGLPEFIAEGNCFGR